MRPVDQSRLLTASMSAGRVGRLVARARRSSGLSERRFAEAVGTVAHTVRLWEMGDHVPMDTELNAIAHVCGLRVDELLIAPDPVAVDFDRHVLRVATAEATLATADNDEVLNAYVWLVRQQRSLKPGQPLLLRAEDIDVLATQLDLEDADLEARLTRITGVDHDDAVGIVRALVSRRVGRPVAGVLGSIGLLGAPAAALAPPAAPSAVVVPSPAPTATPALDGFSLAISTAQPSPRDSLAIRRVTEPPTPPAPAPAALPVLLPSPAPLALPAPPASPAPPAPLVPPPPPAPLAPPAPLDPPRHRTPPPPPPPRASAAPVLAPPMAFVRSLPPPPPTNA